MHTSLQPFIRMVRHPYEEPYHINLVVTASNGRQCGELEIYANAHDLGTVARRLRELPRSGSSMVLWQLGSERPEDRFGFYFRLHLLRPSLRECVLEVRFNNNQASPDREISEFSIEAQPEDLDRFANLLEQFGRLEDRVLEWNVHDVEVHEDF